MFRKLQQHLRAKKSTGQTSRSSVQAVDDSHVSSPPLDIVSTTDSTVIKNDPQSEKLRSYCQNYVKVLGGKLEKAINGLPCDEFRNGQEEPQIWAKGAEEGCGICQTFWEGLVIWDTEYGELGSVSKTGKATLIGGNASQSEVTLITHNKMQNGAVALVRINTRISRDYKRRIFSEAWIVPRESKTLQPELDAWTGSERSLLFARQSLKGCSESHVECRKPKPSVNPTRLIELSTDGGCRLITTSMEEAPRYVTLSHCWGTIKILKLKNSNLAALQYKIPFHQLPQTFQDAVKVTQFLGFRYIWIDSLCIIQDDIEDWRHESSRMSDVYGNATLNIAATNVKDGLDGLFAERDVTVATKHYFRTLDKQLWEINPTRFYEESFATAPLSDRAWTFQERYLAQRTLHFSGKGIFWECHKHIACEKYPDGFPRSIIATAHQFPLRNNRDAWSQAVSIYSNAKLTYASDKLVAMSGVARKFHQNHPDVYLAGLWKSNFERELCWVIRTGLSRPKAKAFKYRAPSWSWASTDQPVTWKLWHTPNVCSRESNIDVLIELLSFKIIPAGADTLGELKYAELQLRCGPLVKEESDWAPGANNWRGKLFFDDEKSQNTSYYYLPILQRKRNDPGPQVYGLLLRKESRGTKGYFSRIGVFDVINPNSARPGFIYPEGVSLPLRNKDLLADESCYEQILKPNEEGIEQYSIRLI